MKSINNSFGILGSEFGASSVRNKFSKYGSEFNSYSVSNAFASSPPVIVKSGKSVAFLSANSMLTGLPVVSLAAMDASCSFSASSPSRPFIP